MCCTTELRSTIHRLHEFSWLIVGLSRAFLPFLTCDLPLSPALCRPPSHWPMSNLQVPDVVHKSDLCRLLLQADRQMMKAFLRDHRAQTAVPPEEDEGYSCHSERTDRNNIEHGSGHVQEGQRRDKIPREVLYAHGGDAGYLSGMSINMDCFSIDSTKIDKETSPSRPGDETWKYTEEVRKIFARLGDAADA